MAFIHHDKIGGHLASDSGSEGWFDVIEDNGSFKVYDSEGGMHLSNHDTLKEAMTSAQHEADAYDRSKVESLKSQWIADGSWDIEDTEGFEAFHAELLIFRLTHERDHWKREYHRLRDALNGLRKVL